MADCNNLIHRVLASGSTLVSDVRLKNAYEQTRKYQNQPVAIVECGVAKGGCLAIMAAAATSSNRVYGFDSFEGMPPITDKDLGDYNKSNPLTGLGKVGDNLSGGIQTVYNTFNMLNVSMANVELVKGYFNDTLRSHKEKIGPIGVLRLDGDWYESVKVCLDELYDQVVDGGCIIIDDYGHWVGAKRAVDEFCEARNIKTPLIQTDYTEFYWYKTS